ncbi:hypothetical protein OROHE_023533 [Orobanche hederae]
MESGKREGIKICLFVEHSCLELDNSLYIIEPPTDVADYEEKELDSDGLMIDPIISPVLTVVDKLLLESCAMVRLGWRIYFFGGECSFNCDKQLPLSVYYFDINHPELGLRPAASLNAPKETPCVFSAHGMIYALGSFLPGCDSNSLIAGSSGIFEKYDPIADKWYVLPDPPLPFGKMPDAVWCDTATLLRDRYVLVGNFLTQLNFIFDLNTHKWVSSLPESSLSSCFPYGSLCVHDALYYLTGFGTWKHGTDYQANANRLDQIEEEEDFVQIVKRGPLFLDDPSRLLHSPCFSPENRQVMTRLDDIPLLLELDACEWRELFHLGGRFFCSVLTAPLISTFYPIHHQPYCRGVWIYVFEEVELPASKSTHFRTLASFSFRIRTPFKNTGLFIRCCAFGSIPDSWVKEPLKKKQVARERETVKEEQIQHAHGSGSKGQGALADEIARLKAELAEKNALLKTIESLLSERQRSTSRWIALGMMEHKKYQKYQKFKNKLTLGIIQVAKTVLEETRLY